MQLLSWLRHRTGGDHPRQSTRQRKSKPKKAPRSRPSLEVLEDRYLLSTLIVSNNLDDGSPGSLRAEVAAAISGDAISFDQSLSGSTINLDPTKGELFINKTLDILGLGAVSLAVSGQNQSRVFEVDAGTTATISGLTIVNGRASGSGGGILIDGGTVTISGCTLTGNTAGFNGGGISNDGNLTIQDCTLTNNSARRDGGAIVAGGTLLVSGSLISNNVAGFDGGGITEYGTLTVTDSSTISGNNGGSYGGGIRNVGGTLTVSNFSTISGNRSSSSGGGIYSDLDGTVTVSNSSIISDNSSLFGGGISILSGTLTVSNSTLSGNQALMGGGINTAGTVTISNSSTISNNTANLFGGGIINYGALNVSDSTVCGNVAPWGADLEDFGLTTLTNSDVCIINQGMTTTTIASSSSTSVFGQVVTFTATVSPIVFLGAAPTGTVTFLLDGSTPLGTSSLDSYGQAMLSVPKLSVGSHTITASYSGDANFIASTSAVVTQTVLSAQQELGLIINQVTDMVTKGLLDSGNGNALIVKLNNAISSLNQGNITAGDNQLNAFINQTNAFLKSGKLDSTDSQELINEIDLAIAAALANPI
jgi:Bacterial Ig-like domain (group 3)/Chlamydia polymorphic membrane protein (Chlamydia_PMP) repeat